MIANGATRVAFIATFSQKKLGSNIRMDFISAFLFQLPAEENLIEVLKIKPKLVSNQNGLVNRKRNFAAFLLDIRRFRLVY